MSSKDIVDVEALFERITPIYTQPFDFLGFNLGLEKQILICHELL
jgi:hypothetical protein